MGSALTIHIHRDISALFWLPDTSGIPLYGRDGSMAATSQLMCATKRHWLPRAVVSGVSPRAMRAAQWAPVQWKEAIASFITPHLRDSIPPETRRDALLWATSVVQFMGSLATDNGIGVIRTFLMDITGGIRWSRADNHLPILRHPFPINVPPPPVVWLSDRFLGTNRNALRSDLYRMNLSRIHRYAILPEHLTKAMDWSATMLQPPARWEREVMTVLDSWRTPCCPPLPPSWYGPAWVEWRGLHFTDAFRVPTGAIRRTRDAAEKLRLDTPEQRAVYVLALWCGRLEHHTEPYPIWVACGADESKPLPRSVLPTIPRIQIDARHIYQQALC